MSTALTFCPLSFFANAASCPPSWSEVEGVLLEDEGDSDTAVGTNVLATEGAPEKPSPKLVVGLLTGFSKNDLFV